MQAFFSVANAFVHHVIAELETSEVAGCYRPSNFVPFLPAFLHFLLLHIHKTKYWLWTERYKTNTSLVPRTYVHVSLCMEQSTLCHILLGERINPHPWGHLSQAGSSKFSLTPFNSYILFFILFFFI